MISENELQFYIKEYKVQQEIPLFESIQTGLSSSFKVAHFDKWTHNEEPRWHFHPEIELVFIKGGSGKRHIGNHLSYFHGGDLVLIGPNLPHLGFTNRLTQNTSETIIQIRPEIFGEAFLGLPEMHKIDALIKRSRYGIEFYSDTRDLIESEMSRIVKLSHFRKLESLLSILDILSRSIDFKLLNVDGLLLEITGEDSHRMQMIYGYVKHHFQSQIRIEEVSDLVCMTKSSFCRFFKKMSGKTFTQFLNEYRIVHATKMLHENRHSLSEICHQSGYNDFPYFTRKFRQYTGENPSTFRMNMKTSFEVNYSS